MRISPELRNRTKAFSASVIQLFEGLSLSRPAVQVVGKQLLRSATYVAAYTREASRACSDAEFCSKLDVLLQEADESMLWLEHLEEDCGIDPSRIQPILKDCDESMSIFVTIVSKVRRSQ